ncbi:MAG: helix-turn-helix transcriptional regulator [Ruminococcaceae bacterium]|nr:helix-turn-helix transcriptional regulator [Oscillospiraceae bacterium]
MAIIEHAGYYENPIFGVSHTHTSCELMCVTDGRADVSAEGFSESITEGCCLLIKSRQPHTVKIASNIVYRRYIAIINPWELKEQLVRPDLFTMLTDTGKCGFIRIENASALHGCFDRMVDIFRNGGNICEELSATLGVLSAFYEKYRPRVRETAPSAARRLSDKARVYIEQNYADNIRVADIAADNFISEGYLAHAFKFETGMSPREYLSHIRCTRAYELILHTYMKFADIAANTGFCSANDLSRKIREYYGRTPTEIRSGK